MTRDEKAGRLFTDAEKRVIALPRGSYGTIVADPPWKFDNQGTRAATKNHYLSLTPRQIYDMPVERLAAPQAHLYLWTTGGHLPIALETCHRWGFVFKYLLTWVKTNDVVTVIDENDGHKVKHVITKPTTDRYWKLLNAEGPHTELDDLPQLAFGLGNWFRRNAELLLFGVRGKLPREPDATKLPDVFFAPRGEHSRKPDFVHDLAEVMSPGSRIELFARRPRKGWKVWGDQV
jgi:N6-adenosine-specific RNA methylase IME4